MENYFRTNIAKSETEEGDNILYPFGPPIFQTQVDPSFSKELIDEGRKLTLKEDDFNPKLAGNLKYGRSYHYKNDYVEKVSPKMISYVEKFANGLYNQFGTNTEMVNNLTRIKKDKSTWEQGKLALESLWINFSQKHDFNPPHTHTGVLSFVIFCKVPEEIFSVNADCNSAKSGHICFQYGEQISDLMGTEYPVKPYENLMFIFPAKLSHYVPAYWVDAERISVSGNFVVL